MQHRPRFRPNTSLEEIIRRAIAAPPSPSPPHNPPHNRGGAVILAAFFGGLSAVLLVSLLVVLLNLRSAESNQITSSGANSDTSSRRVSTPMTQRQTDTPV